MTVTRAVSPPRPRPVRVPGRPRPSPAVRASGYRGAVTGGIASGLIGICSRQSAAIGVNAS
ncbi:hypothetical protein VM98_32520, partial [Streptomyces rubellomurinus subsp. indigoferus]